MLAFRVLLCVLSLPLLASCDMRSGRDVYIDAHVKTVRSAKTVIPAAVQMEELFGSADHFITPGSPRQPTGTWNTVVYFGKRYEFTMQVEVVVDRRNHRVVRMAGEPRFYLYGVSEYSPVTRQGGFNEHYEFLLAEWQKLYEARGDFSVIGIQINPEPAPYFDEFEKAWREPRVPIISLLTEEK